MILAEPDRILGGDELTFDSDGNPIVISKQGLAGRTIAATGASAAVMMQQADTAMYQSKKRGRNHITIFDDSMSDRLQRRVELEQGLRRALNNNEVSVAFQPIVDMTNHHVEGFEALMRWSTNEESNPEFSLMVTLMFPTNE